MPLRQSLHQADTPCQVNACVMCYTSASVLWHGHLGRAHGQDAHATLVDEAKRDPLP